MLMTKERRPAIRTLRGWAIQVVQEAGAIHECEEHGDGLSPNRAVVEVREVLGSIGATCPECLPDELVLALKDLV